jgi:hypothetical protein
MREFYNNEGKYNSTKYYNSLGTEALIPYGRYKPCPTSIAPSQPW